MHDDVRASSTVLHARYVAFHREQPDVAAPEIDGITTWQPA